MTFYKGLLDKLGLKFDALQMGKFKGAAEPLTRERMSPPLRESLESVVGDFYDDLVAVLVHDRHLKDYQAKTYVDQGLFTAVDARKAGLIDAVLYSDQLPDEIRGKLGAKDVNFNREYKTKKVELDFSGFGGMMKLMEVLMGEKPATDAGKKPKIAVVYAVGPIMEGKSNSDMFGSSSMGADTIIEALRKAEADAKVKAIVLRIDSPGGSATASDLIWRETVRLQKPVIASMGDVAGSGGYYIAMGARKIFAAPGTLTGSIGVIGGKLVTGGLMQKLGLRTEVISRGANSGAFSSDQPFTPGERKALMELMQETYRQFVVEGRRGPQDALQQARRAGARPRLQRADRQGPGLGRRARHAARRRRRRQDGRRRSGRDGGRSAGAARVEIVLRATAGRSRPPAKWTRCCPPASGTCAPAAVLRHVALATRADVDALWADSEVRVEWVADGRRTAPRPAISRGNSRRPRASKWCLSPFSGVRGGLFGGRLGRGGVPGLSAGLAGRIPLGR